jgi:hypothetical protein
MVYFYNLDLWDPSIMFEWSLLNSLSTYVTSMVYIWPLNYLNHFSCILWNIAQILYRIIPTSTHFLPALTTSSFLLGSCQKIAVSILKLVNIAATVTDRRNTCTNWAILTRFLQSSLGSGQHIIFDFNLFCWYFFSPKNSVKKIQHM